MEPRQSRGRPPQLHQNVPPLSQIPSRTANSTPISSPGLFSPVNPRSNVSLPSQSASEGTTPGGGNCSPYLHPLQTHRVRETHKANVEHDYATGRKLINQYEIIEELGRGMHGKVKLARNLHDGANGANVAIKIIPRFSKRRKLGNLNFMTTQDKSKKEIAILKKIRHPNIVALLEIIDDPELKKIYMVLEHVELGEIVWRKKGVTAICAYERRRVEREMRGARPTAEEERYERLLERRQAVKDLKRAKMLSTQGLAADYWSLEYGAVEEEELESYPRSSKREDSDHFFRSTPLSRSLNGSRVTSRAPSRTQSTRSTRSVAKALSRTGTPHPSEPDNAATPNEFDMETPLPPQLDLMTYDPDRTKSGLYMDDIPRRERSPSMADSIISHMSSVDYNTIIDPYTDDYSYVPCFTQDDARRVFRDCVLGLEYLHYEGVVHRDIKPANLLWTRDHRVKISDFGVSYFGRPLRDGEPDETVSESEARDFDNDLELSKTVGTPAFFAPELCYTDAYDGRPGLQPKVTEQIDVWSLGVTLYCLVFARIPFLAEDEWQMFKKIAVEDVYIPTKRLRPVNPTTKPDETDLKHRKNSEPYRADNDLEYEAVDANLLHLLRLMLTKNPERRIKLRDVKRHPWVIEGLEDVISWIDDTDPSRQTEGRKIQVDEKEVAHAVIPLNFLERAKSSIKKAVGKVMHARGQSRSRPRATSSAASSNGDSPVNYVSTPHPREARQRSVRGDDYFMTPSSDHPLTQSVSASPYQTPVDEAPAECAQQDAPTVRRQPRHVHDPNADLNGKDEFADRLSTDFLQKTITRRSHARTVTNAVLALTLASDERRATAPTPLATSSHPDPNGTPPKSRETSLASRLRRTRSTDRGVFGSEDKRAPARVALSTATAPGNVHYSQAHPIRPAEWIRSLDSVASEAGFDDCRSLKGYQHGQHKSDTNIHYKKRHVTPERPRTSYRGDSPNAASPPLRVCKSSAADSFAEAWGQNLQSRRPQGEEEVERKPTVEKATELSSALVPASAPFPSPPDDDLIMQAQTLGDVATRTASSSRSGSHGAIQSALTSPSERSSICSRTTMLTNEDGNVIAAFHSDPSLPALVSGASSVSADPEGEFLGVPGMIGRSPLDTAESLTPPALGKEPAAGFPLEAHEQMHRLYNAGIVVQLDDSVFVPISRPGSPHWQEGDGDDDDSDTDEGLTMARSKKKPPTDSSASSSTGPAAHIQRRDTNLSIGSTETAKKVLLDSE